jgi:hypothetical protein
MFINTISSSSSSDVVVIVVVVTLITAEIEDVIGRSIVDNLYIK